MAIFRWGQTWDAFHDLEREVDRLLSSVNIPFPGFRLGRQFPALNLYELDDEYQLVVELPGVRTEDFELTVSNGVLTIQGTRTDPDGVPEHRFRRQERFRGKWHRAIPLPDRIHEDRLRAEFNSGLLKVHLPKAPETQPRQIPVVEGNEP